jgi:hypothetical protein
MFVLVVWAEKHVEDFMSTETDFRIVDIDSRFDLKDYFPLIAELFLESFGKALSSELWDWAYQKNPFGDPLVSMAFYGDKLVGHYAVVPMDLHNQEEVIKGYLSMTTMVSVDFRRHQLFRTLADRVYSRIESRKKSAVVFGFPNDQSAPGFIKRLEWQVSDDFHVVALQPADIEKAQDLLNKSMDSGYRLDLENRKVADWRSNKPSQEWQIRSGLGIKHHAIGYDLMYMSCDADLSGLTLSNKVHAIMPITKEEALELNWEISFPYRFGYRLFNTKHQPKFLVQMCMSDVF